MRKCFGFQAGSRLIGLSPIGRPESGLCQGFRARTLQHDLYEDRSALQLDGGLLPGDKLPIQGGRVAITRDGLKAIAEAAKPTQ